MGSPGRTDPHDDHTRGWLVTGTWLDYDFHKKAYGIKSH